MPASDGPMKAPSANMLVHRPETMLYVSRLSGKPLYLSDTRMYRRVIHYPLGECDRGAPSSSSTVSVSIWNIIDNSGTGLDTDVEKIRC